MFKNMNKLKEWLLLLWFAGMVCFVFGTMIKGTYLLIGSVLGLSHGILLNPLIESIKFGNQTKIMTKKTFYFNLIKNLIVSISICLTIQVIHYNLGKIGIGSYKEPITFSFIYVFFHKMIINIINKLKTKN